MSPLRWDAELQLLARGIDGSLRARWRSGGSWAPWATLAGLPSGVPVAGSSHAILDQGSASFVVTRDVNGTAWYASGGAGGFGPWTSLGAYVQTTPELVLDEVGSINVLATNAAGEIVLSRQRENSDDVLAPWATLVDASLGPNSAPHVSLNSDGRLEVFYNFANATNGGGFISLAQCTAATWDGAQPAVGIGGGNFIAAARPADAAVAVDYDGRLVGFRLNQGGSLAYTRPGWPVAFSGSARYYGRYQCRASTWKGIRYGQPPLVARDPVTGQPTSLGRRFQPPEPASVSGRVDAGSFGPKCAQRSADGSSYLGDEDCLQLNVFAPIAASGLPVMVFLFGGGHTRGDPADYDAGALVNRSLALGSPVVVVTPNFRLGPLGLLAYPGLTDGNLNLRDQKLALEWVRDHIAAFGGDPARVMIFGMSSGSLDVQSLATLPAARGLFWAAGMESGATRGPSQTLADAQQVGQRLAAQLARVERLQGCAPLDCLRDATPAEINAAAVAPSQPTPPTR